MAELEKMCLDTMAWSSYEGSEGDIRVYRRCPECGRYLKEGKITSEPKFKGWTCNVHGEVEPFYFID